MTTKKMESAEEATRPSPPLRMVFRTPTSLRYGILSKDGKSLEITSKLEEKVKKLCFSSDSLICTKLEPDGTLFFDNEQEEEKGIPYIHLDLSPKGNFVITWRKPEELLVRRRVDRKVMLRIIHKKSVDRSVMFFTKNDSFAGYMTQNEVKIWNTRKEEDVNEHMQFPYAYRISCEGITSFSLCPEISIIEEDDKDSIPFIATFQPPSKKPAIINLYHGDKLLTSAQLFRADDCTYKWSPFVLGDVLIKAETTVDASGQSYYGESKLYLLSGTRKTTINIVSTKEGAVHDFAWSPRKHIFVVAAGKSPARCTLYDGVKGDVVFQFGDIHANICLFSPSGRFLVLCGFGNLAGGMNFWDVKKNKLLGIGRADSAIQYGWSPCGRIFMTATVAPKMNTDNGVTFYSYFGEKLSTFPADPKKAVSVGSILGENGLFEARFLPVIQDDYPDLPPSPGRVFQTGTSSTAADGPTAVKKVYRPPGAAGSAIADRIAEEMRGERATASKPSNNNNTNKPVEKKQQSTTTVMKPSSVPIVKATKPSKQEVVEEDVEKLIRKLKKLLRQINDIEESGGAKDSQQEEKLSKKKETEDKIAELENLMKKS